MDICHRGSSPKYTHEHSHLGLWPYVSHGHLLRPVSLATHLDHRQPWGPAHIGARGPSSVMQTVVSMMMPEGQNLFGVKIATVCNSLLNQTQIWLNNHYPAIGHLYSGIRHTSYPKISCQSLKKMVNWINDIDEQIWTCVDLVNIWLAIESCRHIWVSSWMPRFGIS